MRRPSLLGAKDENSQERRRSSILADAAQLARLGHEQELKRNFSFVSMLGLAFAILVCTSTRFMPISTNRHIAKLSMHHTS